MHNLCHKEYKVVTWSVVCSERFQGLNRVKFVFPTQRQKCKCDDYVLIEERAENPPFSFLSRNDLTAADE